MKRIIFSVIFGMCTLVALGFGLAAHAPDFAVHTAAIQYGQKRPYSFYYPYNYQYYYPRPQYYRSSQACYWLYTNGTYVYICD